MFRLHRPRRKCPGEDLRDRVSFVTHHFHEGRSQDCTERLTRCFHLVKCAYYLLLVTVLTTTSLRGICLVFGDVVHCSSAMRYNFRRFIRTRCEPHVFVPTNGKFTISGQSCVEEVGAAIVWLNSLFGEPTHQLHRVSVRTNNMARITHIFIRTHNSRARSRGMRRPLLMRSMHIVHADALR